jgi:mannosyltransferase
MTSDPQDMAAGRTFRSRTLIIGMALLILVLGVVLRILPLGREGLWYDEIFAASYTNLSVIQTAIAVLRFEIHPPLYYMQLTAWSSFGHSDTWLMLNSVAWSALTLIAVAVFAGRRFGHMAGLAAMAICALLGSEIYFAGELRQYAMLGTVAVLTWAGAEHFLAHRSFRGALPLGIAMFPMAAMHSAASLIMLSGLLMYLFPLSNKRIQRSEMGRWIRICLLAGVALLPWLINANFRSISHTHSPSLMDATHTVGGWVLGYGAALENPSLYALMAALLSTALLISAWTVKDVRRLTLWLVFWPLCFGMLLSLAVRPIWLDRVFAFCAPFAAIVLGTALARLFANFRQPRIRVAMSIALALYATASIGTAWLQSIAPRKTQYRELAADLVAKAAPGEFVYVPENIIYWGVARYLVGPEWGSILEVQDPERPDFSEAWQKIYARLGPQKLAWLWLTPRTRQIASPAGPLVVGWSLLPALQTTKSYWVVGNNGLDLATLPLCANRQIVTQKYTGLQLHHVFCIRP